MALTEVDQTIPIPTSVVQKTRSDGTRIMPVQLTDNVGGGSKKTYISTATTTTVLTGGGWLKKIIVPGAGGTLGNVTVYDALTATGNPIWGPTSPSAGQILELQIRCDTGITVVTASATTLWAHYDADAS